MGRAELDEGVRPSKSAEDSRRAQIAREQAMTPAERAAADLRQEERSRLLSRGRPAPAAPAER